MKAWKAEFFLFLVTFIWGATFLFTKLGIADCPPSAYMFVRFSLAFIFSLIFFGRYLRETTKEIFWHGVSLGLMFVCGFILQTYGLLYTTVSKSAFITGMTVVITPFVYSFKGGKNIALWQKIGVLVALIGLWIFSNPDIDNLNWGDIMTLGSTFFWAFYITYIDIYTRGRTSKGETGLLMIYQFAVSIPLMAISSLIIDDGSLEITWTTSLVISLAFNGIMASFLVTAIHTTVQRFTTPVKAALIFTLEPVIAAILAFLIINEFLSGRDIIGAILLMSGVFVSEFGDSVFKYLNTHRVRLMK